MTDHQLQQDVQNALEWEPSVNQTDIGVSVADGVVTLRGKRAFVCRAGRGRARGPARLPRQGGGQ